MNKLTLLMIGFVLLFCNCTESKKREEMNDNIILRVHTAKMETDWYELKGKVTREGFIKEFKMVDWENDYWTETKNETFNSHSIEAFNKDNMTYFGISVCPNTPETFQFYLCYGKHSEPNDSTINRIVKMYGTGSSLQGKVIDFINLYFQNDLTRFENELDKIDFFDEIEDVYWNIESK